MLETSNGNPALHETFRNRLVYNQRFLKMSIVTLLLSPSLGRGTPEGQGVGRRRNRAKPTSGATRHLLPEEGGRNRNKCSALYTSSLKAGYSYSLFMNLHNLILRLNQRFLNTRRFSPLRMTKRGDAQRQYELIREYHLLKKGGEAATRALNLEP